MDAIIDKIKATIQAGVAPFPRLATELKKFGWNGKLSVTVFGNNAVNGF
jgi:hypothetical protein